MWRRRASSGVRSQRKLESQQRWDSVGSHALGELMHPGSESRYKNVLRAEHRGESATTYLPGKRDESELQGEEREAGARWCPRG